MADDFSPFPHEINQPTGAFPFGSETPVGSVPWPGAQQPSQAPIFPSSSSAPGPERRRAPIVIGAVVLVALAGAGIGIAVASGSGHHPASSAHEQSRGVSRPLTASDDDAPAPQPSDAVATTAGTPSTPAAETLPSVSADISMNAVSSAPQLPLVAGLLDTYYSGINAHDGARAASVFAPDGNINPQSAKAVAAFQQNIHTSHDDEIVIRSISPGPIGTGQGLLVHVTFRSRQAAAYGPGGAICSNWNLTYRMRLVSGHLLLKDSVDVSNSGCN